MAINSFDLSRALNSQSYAFKCWENFYYGNNTMGIDSKSMGEIKQTWKEEIPNWQANALDDENAYEIPDDDFDNAYKNGRQAGQDATGYDGKTGGTIARGVGDAVVAGTNAVISFGLIKGTYGVGANLVGKTAAKAGAQAANKAVSKLGEGVAKETAQEVGRKAATETSSKVLEKGGNTSWMIGAPINLIQGTLYQTLKPNKEEKEACDKLQDTMAESQAATMSAQEEMAAMGEELMTLSDEAATYNEEANEQIEEEKTEYDMYMQTYTALKEKAESGEQLTEEEKALYTEIVGLLTESGEVIQEVQDDTSDTVTTIYDDMGTFQEGYDYAAETVAEIQGITDYAESFDKTTQVMCYVEAASQGLNVASSAKNAWQAGAFAMSGSWAFGATAWAWAFVAMAAAGGAMSGVGAAEQINWAGQVGTEIEARKATQDLNAATNDVYEAEVENYDGWMSGVEDLELEIPDEIEAPEDTSLPGETATGEEETAPVSTGFGLGAVTEENDKKKEEEKPAPNTGVS